MNPRLIGRKEERTANLQRKINIFRKKTQTKKQIFFTMISANDIKKTIYSEELINGVVTLEDFFN